MSEGGSEAVLTTGLLTDAGFVALAPLHPEVHALGDGLEAAGVTRRVLEGSNNDNNIYNDNIITWKVGRMGPSLTPALVWYVTSEIIIRFFPISRRGCFVTTTSI